jgi:antitoxin component of MazEF toxin-antitoxin module
MANKKSTQRNIRKITRSGTSLNVTLPVEIMRQLKWKEKQRVVVRKIRGGIVIRDWKKS